MSRTPGQPGAADVEAVREALKEILGAKDNKLASPAVMDEVERIYQSLSKEGLSLYDPGFLLPVYSTLGTLADAVKNRRTDQMHWSARALAATFLLIAEMSLEVQRCGTFGPGQYDTDFSDEPPY